MHRSEMISNAIRLLLIPIFLFAIGVETYAQGSSGLSSRIQTSAPIDARSTPVSSNAERALQVQQSKPVDITDPKFVQQLLASLEMQTKRAESAENQVQEWKTIAGEYHGLYDEEKRRSSLLVGANTDRKDAESERTRANLVLTQQHAEDRATITTCFDRVSKLEGSRLKWTLGTAVFSYGLGKFTK